MLDVFVANNDPVNETDPSGQAGVCVGFIVPIKCWGDEQPGNFSHGYDYTVREDIGPVSGGNYPVGSAAQVMSIFKQNFQAVFPFPITNCSTFAVNAECLLHAGGRLAPCWLSNLPTDLTNVCGWVAIEDVTDTSFTFLVNKTGYFDSPGSTITFSTIEEGCEVYLQQHGVAPSTTGSEGAAFEATATKIVWPMQGRNLQTVVRLALGEQSSGVKLNFP